MTDHMSWGGMVTQGFQYVRFIQDDQVRITGKKIDDLQTVMQSIKDKDYDFAVQFENYK